MRQDSETNIIVLIIIIIIIIIINVLIKVTLNEEYAAGALYRVSGRL